MSITKNINKILKKNKINFYTGVPDSVLKNYLSSLNSAKKNHIICTNEGNAISLATGYYLAKKKMALVYLQNSGLGNIINPITSMVHKKVYGIPMLLFIGWRGAPNYHDEIQHKIQGKITLNQLKILDIKYKIFNHLNYHKDLNELIKYSKKNSQPVAYLFKMNDFEKKSKILQKKKNKNEDSILRYDFLKSLLKITNNARIIATTGFTSRELYQLRQKVKKKNIREFYMVGAMGHSSMVALGYSLNSKKTTICIDGDGSFLMHMGSSLLASKFAGKNFKYILLNNECHESVGCQATPISKMKIDLFSKSIGYKHYLEINNYNHLDKKLKNFFKSNKSIFLNVKIQTGSPSNLLRIKELKNIKNNFN